MATKPPYTSVDRQYVGPRADVAGEIPAPLAQGGIGVNEITGTLHVQKADGRTSTLPTASGFQNIETMTQSAYDALDPKIATTLYIVTPNP